MRNLLYLGPAQAGKRRTVELLASLHGGELTVTSAMVRLQLGELAVYAVTGDTLTYAARLELVRRAHVIVFVADSRRERQLTTLTAWKELSTQLREANLLEIPLVIQLGHRDAADASPIDELERLLEIPAGVPRVDSPADAFLLARKLESESEAIASLLDGLFPKARPKPMGSEELARVAAAIRQPPRIKTNVLTPELCCPKCRRWHGGIEISGVTGGPYGVGDVVVVNHEQLSPDMDRLMHLPANGEPLLWLTCGECPCETLVWCMLVIRDGAIQSVLPVAFTRATYGKANIVSIGGMQREAAALLGVSPGSLTDSMAIVAALARL